MCVSPASTLSQSRIMTPRNSAYHIDKADGIVDLAGSLFKADGGSRHRAETHHLDDLLPDTGNQPAISLVSPHPFP
jgi:hypothetical protein